MPLAFTRLCDLLAALDDISFHDPPLLPTRHQERYNAAIKTWFTSHKVSVNSSDIDVVALLSALFPSKRTDRVYSIQPPKLTKILKRCLRLGHSRWPQLEQWQVPGRGDLGSCVERVLQATENPVQHIRNQVTLEEADQALAAVAAQCRFSAPKARARGLENDGQVNQALEKVYQRLQSREAKWFTRMILKDFSRLNVTENVIYYAVDPRLRVAMQMYDTFEAAVTELRALPASQMIEVGRGKWTQQCANDAHLLPPRVGTKLGPPKWIKAKGGVKHAVTVIDGRTMSMERKHDGEYCQIHIDLSKGDNCIQIFSKSGKDSTQDRVGVHKAMKESLHIGQRGCMFLSKCILEGELVVSSERAKDVLEFHKIRKHVSRSGNFLGTGLDSQPHPWEHLMIMYYDVMLIDEEPVLHRPHRERRKLLERLVTPIKWKAGLVWHQRVDFLSAKGPKHLKKALAFAFVQRWEGLVLKPSDESYFNLARPVVGRSPSCWIKLKKDCIKGLGDTADFAVIGAGYDFKEAARFPNVKLEWTHFYIGCLINKDAVIRAGAKPELFIVDKVSDCIKKDDLAYLNQHGGFPLRTMEPASAEAAEVFDVGYVSSLSQPKVFFKTPFVFEIAGSGFDKAPNNDIFILRFPRVLKIHHDRDWRGAVGFTELQTMAKEARTAPVENLITKEINTWIERLKQLDGGDSHESASWDHTEDELEDDLAGLDEPFASPQPRHPRRARTLTAPLFIRMDTGEMHDQERRLSGGEVVEHPTSKHSTASIKSDCAVQSPPNSSLMLARGCSKEQTIIPACEAEVYGKRSKKRDADVAKVAKILRRSKKLRLQSRQQIESGPTVGPSSDTSSTRPLREITIFASPPKQLRHHSEISKPDAFLVRKVPVGAEEHIHHLHQRSRPRRKNVLSLSSSPTRETNASEDTTTPMTQQTTDNRIATAKLTSPGREVGNIDRLMTPPSTEEVAFQARQIEKLRKCQLVLSPCLAASSHPLRVLLTRHNIPYSFLTCEPYQRDGSRSKRGVYVLVDAANEAQSGKFVWCLIPQIQKWHPKPVMVWDWRLLEAILHGKIGDETDKQKLAKAQFYAKMLWEPDGRNKGAVEVHWRDGRVGRVLWDELRAFHVIDP
ncbi:hypothetical protein MMC21_007694 [Puttea exsequens]|nr:hypothetical protein [Puttea exsequens]